VRLTSSQTWTIVGIASLIWLSISIFGAGSGGGLSVVWSLKDLIPALLSVAWIYEKWLWRFSPIHRIGLNKTPVVIGTWKGMLESFWTDPVTGQRRDPKTVYLTIEQTATTLSVRLLTNESASEQVAGMMSKTEAGHPALSYTYRNRPELRFREGNVSPIHYGSALLEVVGDPATALVGSYWGDRQGSRGEMRFTEHAAAIVQTFDGAERLRYAVPRPVEIPGTTRLMRAIGRGRRPPQQPTLEQGPGDRS
jgi:SMODS-associating 2TM, beta-strand rich effector domain